MTSALEDAMIQNTELHRAALLQANKTAKRRAVDAIDLPLQKRLPSSSKALCNSCEDVDNSETHDRKMVKSERNTT